MLGVMLARKDDLRFREFYRYRAFYCGLCGTLGKRCGAVSRLALSYEMTFLAMLLTALYETETAEEKHRCLVHPFVKQKMYKNAAIDYCADLSAILSYYDLRDGWEDEHRVERLAGSALLSGAASVCGGRWERQNRAVREYVQKRHEVERRKEPLLDTAANLTGEMLAELYVWQEDIYSCDLRTLGFGIGKFIYLLDCFEDIEEDRKHGSYNPLVLRADQPGFTENIQMILEGVMAEASAAFERLPILQDAEIMRNILYSGMWQRFERAVIRRQEKGK